jgi:protein transport protein SEC31
MSTEPPRSTPPSSRPGTQAQTPKSSISATSKYPPGDRSHIPADAQEMVNIFNNDMQRVAGKAPANFAAQVKDTQKRLNILFDHVNNGDLLKPDTVERLSELARALQAKNYDAAAKMQVEIQREKLDECGNWMVSK